MGKKLLIVALFAVCCTTADAKLVSWKSRSSAMRKSTNSDAKSLWKKILILKKMLKKEKDSSKRKEMTARRNGWYQEIDAMLSDENPNYKKMVDAASKR